MSTAHIAPYQSSRASVADSRFDTGETSGRGFTYATRGADHGTQAARQCGVKGITMSNTFKLTIPAGHKLQPCASKEEHRFNAMPHVLALRAGEQSYLVASDGRVLAMLPVQVDGEIDKPTLLPAAACNGNGKPTTLDVNGEVRRTTGKKTDLHALPAPDAGASWRYPGFGHVFPVRSELSGYTAIRLDVNKLANIAGAVSADGCVTLLLAPVDDKEGAVIKPIAVIGQSGDGQAGIGMLVPLCATQDNKANIDGARDYFATHAEHMPRESMSWDGAAVAQTE
jgi:hypothetical protein